MKSVSLRTSLLSIAVLSLLFSIGVGGLSITKMKELNADAERSYADIIPGVVDAEEMNAVAGDLRVAEMEYFSATNDAERADAANDAKLALEKFDRHVKEYADAIPPEAEDEKKKLDTIIAEFAKYRAMDTRLIGMIKSADRETSIAFYRGEMQKQYDQTGTLFDALIKHNEDDAISANQENDATYHTTKKIVTIAVLLQVLVAVLLLLVALYGVIRPIVATVRAMSQLAEGNLEVVIPFTDRTNELGSMAKAVQIFKDSMLKARALEAEQAELKAKAEAERRRATLKMADDLETAVGQVISGVSSASEHMQSSARMLTATAERASEQSNVVTMATQNASNNVQTVAAATEQLSSSILEISSQINRSAKFSTDTVQSAADMNTKIQSLIAAVQKIGSVVDIINNIASQINLLALNATIEAARAGDAGKGFAVVASEVKTLATSTAKATEEITQQIIGIQTATQDSAGAIEAISGTIDEMAKISQSIAAAVEEQSAATKDISRNVQEASVGTMEVSRNIVEVSKATQETGAAAMEILNSTESLAEQSVTLKREISQFLTRVRAE